jgi:DNA repair protein RadC
MVKYTVSKVQSETVKTVSRVSINGPEDAFQLAWPTLSAYAHQEAFYVMTLNTKNQVLGLHLVSLGTLNASIVHPREIFSKAIEDHAASIIVLHNHPAGDPSPSREDIEFTRRLHKAGEIMGISLLDHIIGGNGSGRFQSLKESGVF